jgi:hypothetical protein
VDSYFARHTEKLSVREEDLLRLWDENRVAIHYPEYRGILRQTDNESKDPEDYEETAKSAMRCLKELGDRGGYVWTESLVSDSAKSRHRHMITRGTNRPHDALTVSVVSEWYQGTYFDAPRKYLNIEQVAYLRRLRESRRADSNR